MKLFIANPTVQAERFVYRFRNRPQEMQAPIPAGVQVQIGKELLEEDINYIIETKQIYGMIDYRDVNTYDGRISLLYGVDEQIPAKAIADAAKRNERFMVKAVQDSRKDAAIALANQMNERADGGLKSLTMTVKEQTKPGQKPQMGDEVIIVHEPSEPSMRPRNKRRA